MKKLLIALCLLIIPYQVWASDINYEIKQLWGKNRGNMVINRCENARISKNHCKIVFSFVGKAESNFGKNAHKYNIFGNSKYKFNSDEESMNKFLEMYNKYYYKVKYKPSDFYSIIPYHKPRTWYCIEGKDYTCKNGARNSWKIYNQLKKYL